MLRMKINIEADGVISMKTCTLCHRELSVESFALKNKAKGSRNSYCRDCQNVRSRAHYYANKADYLERNKKREQELKNWISKLKDKPCVDCGKSYPPYVMHFDHLKDKEFNVSQGYRLKGHKAVLLEIEKCDLVCANCHAERTHRRLVNSVD